MNVDIIDDSHSRPKAKQAVHTQISGVAAYSVNYSYLVPAIDNDRPSHTESLVWNRESSESDVAH